MAWDDAYRAYLSELDQKKPVIACGDFNVAHQEIDIKIQDRIGVTPDSPMRSGRNSLRCWKLDLWIPSVTAIQMW